MRKKTILSFALLGALSACPAIADTVRLKNGDRLSGTVDGLDGTTLTLQTDYAGTLHLAADLIASIATDGPVTVRIEGIGWTTGRLTTDQSGTFHVVREKEADSIPVTLGAIAQLLPGTEEPLGFQWTGRVNVGLTERSGNTDSNNYHVDAQVTGRAEKDRITMRGEFNRELDRDGNRTADNFTASVRHDRFVSKKVFLYSNAKLERDMLADLRLRTTLSAGAGYQFIETERTKLSMHAGPAYVNENFETSPDKDYLAFQWGVDFEYIVWRNVAEFFHHHEGTIEGGDSNNFLVTSSTGLRFPFGHGLSATAQLDLDYDNQPAPNVSSTDKTYLITLGYAW